MKLHTIYTLLMSAVLGLCISCVNEFEFSKQSTQPLLVMNAFINTDSTNNVLYLNYTGRESVGKLAEAIVEVRVNGLLVETAQMIPTANKQEHSKETGFLITSKFKPNDQVRIDAWTPQTGHHAWVEETILPPPLPIVSIDTMTVNISYPIEKTNSLLKYRITIQDRPNEKNCYRVVLYSHYR